ncbi:HAD family hydrolase [Nocardiopsis sp. ATB16-24]|uniref:HAD family hydrolase n=1 Tax=Nocardiopsis sp. ATB16-24 TaxID=3019555 RepID=UPI002553144D|nr:HAD family hydrolase [Nocardiopsis sp. ATB16-24]
MSFVRGVLLDLDGTLVDTPSAIMDSFHEACAPYGAVPLSYDASALIGKPLDTIFPLLLPHGDQRVWEEAKAVFRSSFARRTLTVASSLVFPGVDALLADLAAKGTALAVVTSKVTHSAQELMEASGLDRHIDLVIGHDQAARGKPAPDPALLACSSLGLEPAECVVVGDSPDDAAMAVAAGMPAVGVTWGVSSAAALRSAGAATVIDTVSDLSVHLHGLTHTAEKAKK